MSTYSITFSTELMQNYLQAEILAPDAKFQALQTQDGTSLLFSIGTDNALYVTKEVPQERSGWARSDLSSAQIRKDFPGQSGVTCKDFASAQSTFAPQAAIDLAMVLADRQNDHLYLSMGDSDADTSWTSAPAWAAYPFDDPAHPLAQVKITNVLISEAADAEYIVVDVLRDPSSPEPLIFRYYIDVNKTGGYAWHPHDLAIDLEAGKYSSCLGRRSGQYVDGLYTIGQVGGSAQFMYQPLYNVFNPNVPASPSLFRLPGGGIPDAIAACRNADNSSDLYATAGGTLYYLGSHNQANGATAVAVLSSPRFNGVRSLFAAASGNSVMVWGLNGNDEIFYATCALSQVTAGALAWNVPLPILTGAEQVAPYLDRANSANTFFAHTGQNQLVKAVKSPDTSMWTFRNITLDPPASTMPAQSFSSYTTRVQLTSTATGQPAAGVPVSISATNVASVRINYLYYVIGPAAIQVSTDPLGVVTIVEPLQTVSGSRLTVSAGGAQVTINPMDGAFKKAAALNTPTLLSNATITNQDGTTKKLVPAGASQAELRAVATGNTQLSQAYATLPATRPGVTSEFLVSAAVVSAAGRVPAPAVATSLVSPDSLLVDAGDLFSWLGEQIESGAEYVVELIEDTATKLWNFVVTIAGQAYQCVLNCVETVVAAAQWLYSAIKTAAEDLLKYLEFLFDWADITRTKYVLANLTKVFLNYQVGQIEAVKAEFDDLIASAEQAVNAWAGVDWSGLGADGTATPNSKSTPSAQQSAPASLLAHHYQNNAQGISQITPAPPVEPSPNPITVLLQALEREGETIGDTISRLQELAANFDSMPVLDILKELMAIIADLVLESAKNVIDALFDILYDIAKAAVAVLDTPIYIPVVSDILKGFGVPAFSFLDIVCWIAAVPATLVYKLAEGTAPFPDNAETNFLITVPDYPSLLNAFAQKPAAVPAAFAREQAAPALAEPRAASTAAPEELISISAGTATAVHIVGHCVSGFCSLVGAILSGFEAAEETGENPWGIPSAVAGVLGGVSGGVANALVPHDPIDDQVVSGFSLAVTGIRILCKIIFSGPAQSKIAGSVTFGQYAASDGRGVGAVVDAVLVSGGLVGSIGHFVELSQKPASGSRSIAIVDETSTLTNDISRVSYAIAVNTEEIPKAVAIGVMTVANVCTGGLQIAECIIK